MEIRLVLVAAALCACGGGKTATPVDVRDAGKEAADSGKPYARDAGHTRDAGQPDTSPSELGGTGGVAGQGGTDQSDVGLAGTMAAGGTGGRPDPRPEGGKGGSAPTGGAAAPQERVIWSQDWTVAVHSAVAYGAAEGDTMGLQLDAGEGCLFGHGGAPSGSSQTYETDGTCITKFSSPTGSAVFWTTSGNTDGVAGIAELVGWKEAVSGHTVKHLRRTQTYTVQLLGSGNMTWDYADFSGKWEALGY